MTRAETTRNVTMALLGTAGLVLKSTYRGPLEEVVYAHGGNFTVSFALYFVAVTAASRIGLGRLTAAAATLIAVEAFEITNGFGVMTNTYDPADFVANAAGIGVAVVIDLISSSVLAQVSGID
ncbi:MAG TPA: hypothetical protein VMY18_02840 [Acidobacteriota bacterium]|nr:hypothetical protein [Acidobacteriota bacterium]